MTNLFNDFYLWVKLNLAKIIVFRNSQGQTIFGGVRNVVKKFLAHDMEKNPEVARRDEEIMLIARNMTPEEHQKAIWDYARTKWHRLRNETPDYKAKNEGLKIK